MEKLERKTDRQERIPGFSQEVIRNTKVAVLGAGATGNEVLKCLALTGFGYVFLSDMDHISRSNLSRTVLFSEKDVGKRKCSTAAEKYSEMNVDNGVIDYLDGDMCHALGDGVLNHVDLVIGCLDNEQTRLFASHLCQMLGKPYIDTGIGGFNWNVFPTSGKPEDPCYACTMGPKSEEESLNRVRNSCDVTRKKAAEQGTVPTINIAASAAASFAVQEAIKISHYIKNPEGELPKPRFGYMTCFTAEENKLETYKYSKRKNCEHHDNYENYGGVHGTIMSARWKLRDVLNWVKEQYGKEYGLAIYKDNACSDRSFITTAHCVHCGKEIDVYRPQPLEDNDLLCNECVHKGLPPMMPSEATIKCWFCLDDDQKVQEMSLLELGIPLLHILEFSPIDEEGESLFLELSGDISEVMPTLPE